MDPQMIDYYNKFPSGINVIDRMNEEFDEVQKENEMLKKKLELYKFNFRDIPLIEPFKLGSLYHSEKELEENPELENEIDSSDDIEELMFKIEKSLKKSLKKTIEGCEDEPELNMEKVFANKDEYIDILDEYLFDVPREWCEYRIISSLKHYYPLKDVDGYWWNNLIKDEYITNKIIDMITSTIINGWSQQDELYLFDSDIEETISLYYIYHFKCHQCKKHCDMYSIDDYSICHKCFWENEESD